MTTNTTFLEIVGSERNSDLFKRGTDFIRRASKSSGLLVIAGEKRAADDLVYSACTSILTGIHRFTIDQIASEIARPLLASAGISICERLPLEATAAHVTYQADMRRELGYFDGVAQSPRFPSALYRTLSELRSGEIGANDLLSAGAAGLDLAKLLTSYEEELKDRGAADMAHVLRTAVSVIEGGQHPLFGIPVLLFCTDLRSSLERQFVIKLINASPAALVLGSLQEVQKVEQGLGIPTKKLLTTVTTCLESVRFHLFSPEPAPERCSDESFELFSAAGEGLECVEIVRRILKLAFANVPFDRMAVVLRSPSTYITVLEEAFLRAGIPGYFATGVQQPNRAGRALISLLEFAREGFPARRFVEYLSLDQVPNEPSDDDEDQLWAPLFWERLVSDAAVIGGRNRWQSRLTALQSALKAKRESATVVDEHVRLDRERNVLERLQAYVLPLIEKLESAPEGRNWGAWLDWLGPILSYSIRDRRPLEQLFDDLAPLSEVQPVTLDRVLLILSEHLLSVSRHGDKKRFGQVFVGAPADVRGMDFDVVFIAGIAEASFPRVLIEDPLLLNEVRSSVSTNLQIAREADERQMLQTAVAACGKQLIASYPRMDLLSGRARVPSLYAFELLRAAGRRYKDLKELENDARARVETRAAWPAPKDAVSAIDNAEFDLAILRPQTNGALANGCAAYLQKLSSRVYVSLKARFLRWNKPGWNYRDGFHKMESPPALAAFSLKTRPYSASALEDYAECPYRFYLRTICGMRPVETIDYVWYMDPALRGDIYHAAAACYMQRLLSSAAPELGMEGKLKLLEEALCDVEREYRERNAPAILATWNSEINLIRNDLRGLVRFMDLDSDWTPMAAEFAFGLPGANGVDPGSLEMPVDIGNGVRLRGSVDLIERHKTSSLRVKDYKTGRFVKRDYYENDVPVRVKGGSLLQPLLYALAIRAIYGAVVESGSLCFFTIKGRFQSFRVPLDAETEEAVNKVLTHIEEGISKGVLLAAPAKNACVFCDFRVVCGPYEEERIKAKTPLSQLQQLRETK